MNPWIILAVLIVVVGAVLIARAVRPRVRRTQAPLLRPVEALDQFETRCVTERRRTLHVRFATGGVMCLDCRARVVSGGAP